MKGVTFILFLNAILQKFFEFLISKEKTSSEDFKSKIELKALLVSSCPKVVSKKSTEQKYVRAQTNIF